MFPHCFWLWPLNFYSYQSSVSSDADVIAAVNVESFPDGQAVILEAIFGSSLTYDDYGNLSGAAALVQVCSLRNILWEL